MKLKLLIYFFILLLINCLACTNLNVRHLTKRPIQINTPQEIKMRYLNFIFTARYGEKQTYIIKGNTFFKNIPMWASYIQELWLTAYLCNEEGKVLAKELKVYQSQPIPKKGLPFSFKLKIKKASYPINYITFGYSFKLSPNANYKESLISHPLSGEKDLIFYASQKAFLE